MNMNLININLDTLSNTNLNKNKEIKESDKFDKIIDKKANKDDSEDLDETKDDISEEELSLLYMHILENIKKLEDQSISDDINTIQNRDEVINKDIFIAKDELLINDKNETLSVDIQYFQNGDENKNKNLDVEEIYEVKLDTSKVELAMNSIAEDKSRITSSDELDVLGQISVVNSNNSFDKYSITESMNDTSQVNIENKVNQEVINNIKFMKTEDIKELSIKLRPRELGDMNIKIMQENDTLKAIVSVGEKDVYNMLNKNISEIKQHLELFNVKDISIVIDSENTYSSDSFDKSFEEHQSRQNDGKSKKGKNENIIVNIDNKEEGSKNEGINLLA